MVIMQKFQATSPSVEVNGETILAFVNGVKTTENSKLKTLKKYGIVDPQPGKWYSQQAWLDAFKEVSTNLGDANLRMIGKAIISNAKFPPINGTQQAFEILDVAYKMNHRKGEIGYYKLVLFNETKRTLQMECNTPYPESFDEGILRGLFATFKPKVSGTLNVKTEKSKQGILYTLTW